MKAMRIQQDGISIQNGFPKAVLPPPHSSFFFLLFSLFTFLFSLFSCKTVEKTPEFIFDSAAVIPLETGASAYILTDVQDTKLFLSAPDKYLQQIVDSTRYAVAAFYPSGDTRRYHLSAWGTYPSSRAKMALGANKDWKKQRSGVTGSEYWHSEKDRLSVAMSTNQVFVSAARSATPADPFPTGKGIAVPEGFNEFRRGAIFSCWFENPGALIGQKLAEMGITLTIPAEQVFFCIFPVSGQTDSAAGRRYESVLKIQFSSETQASSIVMLLSFTRGLFSLNADPPDSGKDEGISGIFTTLASLLFSNPPVQEGKSLIIKTNALDGENIALLFKSFSLW
jgi:hypothetical protein